MQTSGGVLNTAEDVRAISIDELPTRCAHSTVVLVEPTFFDRSYEINPYMEGTVDRDRAREQWEQLRDVYDRRVDDLRILDPGEIWSGLDEGTDAPPPTDRPDMVFVANHALPSATGAEVLLARMATSERAGEPIYFRAWAEAEGYDVRSPPSVRFEGMGDALWHPGRRLLWGGYGERTDRHAYEELSDRLDTTVVPIELTDERYYHLDVCLAPLSESMALIQPDAFTSDGLTKIEALFDTVLEAPTEEATGELVVNVEVVDDTVILGTDAPRTTAMLEDAGFDVLSIQTSEFRKAGGSVCCLTLSLGPPG
jgi:N-dimethylarginine dimethylaminohydrolase